MAAAAVATWQDVALQLAPVIGARGFDVLLGRALHLASRSFPWLGDDWSTERAADRAQMLDTLGRRIAEAAPAAAAHASRATFDIFNDNLAALIGAPLAERLLDPVWALPAPAAKEIAS
jgi:hypothetical protein